MMSIPFRDKFNQFSPERQAKIQARAEALIAAETLLRNSQSAQDLFQGEVSDRLETQQEIQSLLQLDLPLSTLQETVRAMGGELRLLVEFPDRPPVILSSSENSEQSPE